MSNVKQCFVLFVLLFLFLRAGQRLKSDTPNFEDAAVYIANLIEKRNVREMGKNGERKNRK